MLLLLVSCALTSFVIKWSDIVFKDTYFALYIPRSKTDQYGSGATRVVARTGNPTCPFDMLCRYAKMSGDSLDSTEFVFRSLYKRKNGTHALPQALGFLLLELGNYLSLSSKPLV